MKLQLKEGRDFSKDITSDSIGFMLNETAVNKMGLINPVGQTVTWGNHPGRVVGVIKDFHFSSMHQQIDPLIIRLDEHWTWGTILIRTRAGDTKEVIAGIEKICKQLNPDFPFTYQFSDQEFAKLYKSEQLVSGLSNIFAFLAIFISCLGLFGLAMFTAQQRAKEISVRKVLGASVRSIISLLLTNFLKPVAIAFLIAVPVAWYAISKWLEDFAYRVTISWWIFAVAGGVTVLIALFTISFQSIKAALANPVLALKNE